MTLFSGTVLVYPEWLSVLEVPSRLFVLLGILLVSSGGGRADHNVSGHGLTSLEEEKSPDDIADLERLIPPDPVSCEVAKIKCALRSGCGAALQAYMLDCADLMYGRVVHCDQYCRNALIALTSTEEGFELVNCRCSDSHCQEAKTRVETCGEDVVLANARGNVVPCSVAHLICAVDNLCSTALTFYDRFCRRMFIGKSCSYRCNNSISILEKQEKAAKLASCVCDGTEPFDCHGIKANMNRLCFYHPEVKHVEDKPTLQEEENEIVPTSGEAANNATTASAIGHHPLPKSTGVACALFATFVVRWKSSGL